MSIKWCWCVCVCVCVCVWKVRYSNSCNYTCTLVQHEMISQWLCTMKNFQLTRASKIMHHRTLHPEMLHIADCEGWWLSGCHSSEGEHARWAVQARCPEFDSRLLATSLFTFLYFTSKHLKSLYFQCKARSSKQVSLLFKFLTCSLRSLHTD